MDSNAFLPSFHLALLSSSSSALCVIFLLPFRFIRAQYSYTPDLAIEREYLDQDVMFSQVGKSDFYHLRSNDTGFIDKTVIVDRYLRTNEKIILITRPRQWGKTINMQIIKKYLEIEVDRDGNPLPENELDNLRLFVGTAPRLDFNPTKKLKHLKVARYENCVRRQGNIPIIYLPFGQVGGDCPSKIESTMRSVIDGVCEEHKYIKKYMTEESKVLTDEDKIKLNMYITSNYRKTDLIDSVRFVSSLLHKHFNRTVHILIDDFDTAINKLYFRIFEKLKGSFSNITGAELFNKPFESEEFKESFRLIRDFFNACLKNNEALEKALITGVMRYDRANVFSDIADLREYNVLSPEFSEYYGFSTEEMKYFLGLLSLEEKGAEIEYFYKGYNMGGRVMYNPLSIMSYFKQGNKYDNYWVQSGCEIHIDNLFTYKEAEKWIRVLADDGGIHVNISALVTYDINAFSGVFTYLLYTGYLTPAIEQTKNRSAYENYYILAAPNREVKTVYTKRSG